MELGLSVIADFGLAEVRRIALAAERLGYSHLWLPDEGIQAHDVWVTLGSLAAVTGRLHLGPGITNPYTRHPAVTANALRSLQEVSGGRGFLGLGAGGSLTLQPLGLSAEHPLGRVAGALRDIRAANPGVPLWLGAKGPRLLELGAREADGILLSGIPLPVLGEVVGRLRNQARGRLALALYTHVAFDQMALDRARAHFTYQLVDMPAELRSLLGVPAALSDTIRSELALRGQRAAARLIPDEVLQHFVLSGSTEQIGARLHQLAAEHGLDQFVLPVNRPEGAISLLTKVASLAKLI